MKQAIIKVGSKQYTVKKGDKIELDLLHAKGKTVTFEDVLLVEDGNKVQVGTPTIKGASVKAKIIEADKKGEKIDIMRFKAKSRYRKRMGHRQRYTIVEIQSISLA